MSRRAWLVLIALTGGVLLAALAQPFVFDFAHYEVLTGYAASAWTWLAVAGGIVLAIAAVVTRRLRFAPLANLGAGVALALALVHSAQTTPARVDEPVATVDCSNRPSLGCSMHRALDHLSTGPRAGVPRRWFVELALGAYVLASTAGTLRREA
jgi:hypothetical protein